MEKSDSVLESSSRFLASTLHEIRTPLQTIIGTLELLSTTPLNKEQTEYVRQIQFSSDIILSLANDILDISKIRSKEFKLEMIPFELLSLVERVTDLVSIEAFNKGLEIIFDFDSTIPTLIGDPTRIQQILLNIIKNAVKFTSKGYIYITVSKKNKESILFRVTDTGLGIPEDKRRSLFTDYYQVEASTTRKYGGTGLGLSISKTLVEAMNGTIGVDPNPNGGSSFWFTIPLIPSPSSKKMILPALPPFDTTNILLVDDSALALQSLTRHLNLLGYKKIQTAMGGDEALKKLRSASKKEPFTFVFIDMIMPKMDGWRLASDIKSDDRILQPQLYLIVPEGQMGGEAKMKLLNWFNGYLYKPIKHEKLIEILNEALIEPVSDLEVLESPDAEIDAPKKEAEDLTTVATGIKILVVEDHPVNRKLLVTFLNKFGATVFEAGDGETAVIIAKDNPTIDLIFMDIQLPGINGAQATAEIRNSGFKGIIIACTANNDSVDFEDYKRIGMNDVLPKPFKSSAIRTVIGKWKPVFSLPVELILDTTPTISDNTNPIWDKNDFLDTIDNNKTFGIGLLKDFITQTEILIKQISPFIENGNYEELRRIGHTLKGSSDSVSAKALASHATNINLAAREKDKKSIILYCNKFITDFNEFKKQIIIWEKEK